MTAFEERLSVGLCCFVVVVVVDDVVVVVVNMDVVLMEDDSSVSISSPTRETPKLREVFDLQAASPTSELSNKSEASVESFRITVAPGLGSAADAVVAEKESMSL